MQITVAEKIIALDKDGFLKNRIDWNQQVADQLAINEGITLSDEHWQILSLIQDFYHTFELSPAMRPLVKYIGQQLGKEKGNSLYLLQLFPGSPAKLAAKIAGLPKPENCL
jgi:tRNA 2-thiouridine synthesizing protein E